jgi:hypothetical protein
VTKTLKLVLFVCVAWLVALGVGWLWGVSGKRDATRALQASQLRNILLEARGAVLDARLDVYSINFGNASRHLETARSALGSASEQFKSDGRQEEAKRVDEALAQIAAAQQMAGKLDQGAHSHAGAAVKAIDELLGAGTRR